MKRSSNPPSDTEQLSPTSGAGKVVPAQPSEEGSARKDENKVDGVSAAKGQVGTPAVVRETEGRKTTGRKRTGKMAKRITTPDLHLSQRQVKKIQPRSSVLQANMLLSTLTVKMKMREITGNRPLHSVVSPSLSPPWNIREQIKPLSRQDKIKLTISWRPFLT